MCVKGEESVGSPGAQGGKSMAGSSLSLWGSGVRLVAGQRRVSSFPVQPTVASGRDVVWDYLELLSQLAFVVEEFRWGESVTPAPAQNVWFGRRQKWTSLSWRGSRSANRARPPLPC